MVSGLGMLLKASGIDPDALLAEFRGQLSAGVQAMQGAQAAQLALLSRVDQLDAKLSLVMQALSIDDVPLPLLALSTVKDPSDG